MSIPGSPPYDNPTSMMPSQTQTETTASFVIAREALGLSKDTLRPFIEMNKETAYEFNTDSSKPSIAPFGRSRTSGTEVDNNQQFQAVVNEMIQSMPEDVQAKLSELKKLKPDEKNNESFANYSEWDALNKLVNLAGQADVFISNATAISSSELELNTSLALSKMPEAATKNMVADAEQMAENLRQENKRRQNHPNNDPINALVNNFSLLVSAFEKRIKG